MNSIAKKLGAPVALAAALLCQQGASAAEQAVIIAPPAVDEPAGTEHTATAIFAGGCFWGVQGVFQHVKGVTNAVSGYAGGDSRTATYDSVSEGDTGHAESVKITYDPTQISYGKLLQIYFSVAHNPTQLNRQGPDIGPQYRSTIFPQDAEQAGVARAYIAQLNQAKAFDRPVVTTIETDRAFFPAEDYHQDYMTLHPTQPYIAINDLPKIGELKRYFPAVYRDKPVLVKAGS